MAKASTLFDEFATLDTTKWVYSTGWVASAGEIQAAADPTGYAIRTGVSVDRFDATNDTVVWHMPEVVKGGFSTLTGIRFQTLTAGDRLQLYYEGSATLPGLLRIRKTIGYANTDVSTTWQDAWKWFRYRNDGTNLFLDSSPDGVTWTQRLTTTTMAGLDSVKYELQAGGGSSTQVPTGTGRFASLNPASSAVNQPPVADAGLDQSVATGSLVTLTGSGTDSDGTIASYAWTLLSKPAGSTATLAGTGATRTFTADLAGTYEAQLIVTDDDGASSSPNTVTVSAGLLTGPVILLRNSENTAWLAHKDKDRNAANTAWIWE